MSGGRLQAAGGKSWELRAEPRASLALPGEAAASSRAAGSGVRLVYGRLRHARSEGGEGAAGGIGVIEGDQ